MALKRYIGDYVSNYIVTDWRRKYFATVEELNEMDREQLARKWYKDETEDSPWKKRRFDEIIRRHFADNDHFFDEVARYIDDRIPRAYMKYHNPDQAASAAAPARYVIKPDADGKLPFGLIYHYPTNNVSFVGATPKQIRYLVDLAAKNNHIFFSEGITKDEARACIDYYLNMDYKVEPECFSKHFKKSI